MIYNLDERLDYLRKISAYDDKDLVPDYLKNSKRCKAEEFFDELERAVKIYLNRDSEFELIKRLIKLLPTHSIKMLNTNTKN